MFCCLVGGQAAANEADGVLKEDSDKEDGKDLEEGDDNGRHKGEGLGKEARFKAAGSNGAVGEEPDHVRDAEETEKEEGDLQGNKGLVVALPDTVAEPGAVMVPTSAEGVSFKQKTTWGTQ